MGEAETTFHLFNLNTMSGVHPGSRTAMMQRIRLLPLPSNPHGSQWARLLWYASPPSCVLYLQAEGVEQWQEAPLVRIENPLTDHQFAQTLKAALAAVGWQPFTCGTCCHWQELRNARSEEELPLGRCSWETTDSRSLVSVPETLRQQVVLAMGCPAWRAADEASTPLSVPQAATHVEEAKTVNFWAQLRAKLRRNRPENKRPSWGERIVERSGVGAGTEPCFACQGRIANLGALTVATDEDDKRTFSIWRCRRCHTFYLNDWIDRWERLDSLETEESYYRLAPVEAIEILALFEGVAGGEHPAGRRSRTEQRQWLEAFVQNRPRLSHQIRQGR